MIMETQEYNGNLSKQKHEPYKRPCERQKRNFQVKQKPAGGLQRLL